MHVSPAAEAAPGAPRHSPEFRRRRLLNWFPLGLTYALLYMGRYNLTVAKTALGDLMSKADFGTIFGVGAWVYALAFLVNGPLTDRIGGKRAILIGAAGSAMANLGMAAYVRHVLGLADPSGAPLALVFSILYGINMYFQSYGAVAIVKVNAHWFHVRERGTFSGIFGIMISAGLFLAFDVSDRILKLVAGGGPVTPPHTTWVFVAPAALLLIFFTIETFLLKDKPSEAGFADFDTGDASSGEEDVQAPVLEVIKRMLSNKVIMTIAFVEFCTGVIRNGVMHWYRILAKEKMAAGVAEGWKYVSDNWGLMLMVAGIIGGVVAGLVSDRLFQSRRAPAAGFLYAAAAASALLMIPALGGAGWAMGLLVFLMSICVIGTHGLLSGTATMDFGGRKGAATAVGIIDGFVYLGTGVQSLALGYITTKLGWTYWPVFLAPFAFIGFRLLTTIWHAKPAPRAAPKPERAPAAVA